MTDQSSSHHRVAERVAEVLWTDDNILAVAVFGSVIDGTVGENSDVDLYVVERGEGLVWRSVYLREDLSPDWAADRARPDIPGSGPLVHLQYISEAQFVEVCSGLGGGALHHALSSAELIRYRDERMADLFGRMRRLSPADRDLRLLEAAGNLCHALYLAEKPILGGGDGIHGLARAIKVLETLARTVILQAGEIPGPLPLARALQLDSELAAAVAPLKATPGASSAGHPAEGVLDLARARLGANLLVWSHPLIAFLQERGEPATMEEIEEASPFSKLKGDLEKLILLLVRRGYLREVGCPFKPTLSPRPLLEEIAYTLP